MTQFTVRALKRSELPEAWPIVHWSNLYANADWWLSDAMDVIDDGGGVLVALAPDSSIHGVATFKVPANPAKEKVLRILTLITFELSGRAPARNALVKALERIAAKLECTHVMLPLAGSGGMPQSGELFASAG